MMPNSNNLALTLVSEKGNTPTKNSKKTSITNDGFLKFFGKNKKEEKEKTSKNSLGIMMQPFKINGQTYNEKEKSGKELGITKTTSVKNEVLLKNTGNKAGEVLGNRIESTKSTNLKLEDKTVNKESLNIKDAKKTVDTQIFKGNVLESSVIKPNVEVQNKGRIMGTSNNLNPLQGIEFKAKDNSNFVKTETKRLEPSQELISGYGLKKINNQIKLEEKVESAKELMPLQKSSSKEKLLDEKVETVVIATAPKEITFESKETPSLSRESNNIDYNSIVKQVENGLKINYNNQLKEMKIKLQPEELGEVEVKMTIENNIMKAEFVVESQTVKEILESKFDTLRSSLENKGFNGAEINVSVSTGENKKSQNFFMTDKKNKKEIKDTVDYVSKIGNLDSNSKTTKISDSSGIDIMV